MKRSLLVALSVALVLAVAGSAASEPQPLRGVPLAAKTGLRLLVANNPPYVLDVDSGRRTRVAGLPDAPHAVLSVRPAGDDALVVLDRARPGRTLPESEIYVIRHRTTKAKLIGRGWGVAPSADGRAVWISAYLDSRRCRLREVALDGRELRGPRAFPCGPLDAGGSLGVIVQTRTGAALVDPESLRTLLHAPRILAVAGTRVLVEDRRKNLTLIDRSTGKRLRLRWPSSIGGDTSQGGTDEAAVDARGASIAVGFSDPAYQGDGTQVTDVWLLDPASGDFRELPDMPAIVSLKFTSWVWTRDGRLVLLAETAGRRIVGVWKPGDARIGVKRVRLPEPNSGSDSFVAS